jgi:hypothetical protein
MYKIFPYSLALLTILLIAPAQKDKQYPYKNGKPTSRGIDYYVKVNKDTIKKELETYLNDSIFLSVEISTDNISEYTGYDSLDMAYHITYTDGTDEIVIDNRERYVAYDINDLSKLRKLNLSTHNEFVKTAVIHELMHTYFLQKVVEGKYLGVDVYKEYDYRQAMKVKIYPNVEEAYGAEFIEEGICQYVVRKMKLEIRYKIPIPKTVSDIIGNNGVKYNYSVNFLKDFLDSTGINEGIEILIRNRPPTYEEILNPNLFFNRLH